MNTIWNESQVQRSGNSNESGEQQNYFEEAVEYMGAEMQPFVALMEDLLPTSESIKLAGTGLSIKNAEKKTKNWNLFRRK